MIIEFADPGYNWGFLWWPVGVMIVCLAIFIWAGIVFDWDEGDPTIGITAVLFILSVVVAVFVPILFGSTDYEFRVTNSQRTELQELGFSDVDVSGDRFTAATEDGEYFRGVLVDLKPESGYAYQVLELNQTGD